MMLYRLNTLFELIFPDLNVRLILIFTATSFVTWWFLLKLLNPMIDAMIAIIKTALLAILTVFFGYIDRLSNAIHKIVIDPVRSFIQNIPVSIKILFYLLLGLGIFATDQRYGKYMFEGDETIGFYQISLHGQMYWVSHYALVLSGFFISLAAFYSIGVIWNVLKYILDQPVRISVIVRQ